MSSFTDSRGRSWTRNPVRCVCDDGSELAVVPAMTDAYVLSVIEQMLVHAIPRTVTMRQARLALNAAAKLATVQAVINSMSEPAKTNTQIWWDYSSTVERDQPLVGQLGAAIGLDSAGVDNLFVVAASL